MRDDARRAARRQRRDHPGLETEDRDRRAQRGDKYIRRLLVGGAIAVIRHARTRATPEGEWARAMLARKPAKVVALALANKTARIAWAVMKRGETYLPREKFVGSAA